MAILLWFFLYLLELAQATVGAEATPSCSLALTSVVVKPRRVWAGHSGAMVVRIKVANGRSGQAVFNGTFELQLPSYTTYKRGLAKATTGQRLARVGGGKRPAYDADAQTLTWTGLNLQPRGAMKFKAKVRLVSSCYPGPSLNFTFVASFLDLQGAPTCPLDGAASVAVSRKEQRFGRPVIPYCGPTPAPTLHPTPMPTRSCGLGEYRPPAGGHCQFCAPGTYWNQTYETNACLACPADQTSLQGAARCYTPCQAGTALNTTDLTCVTVPASVFQAANDFNVTIDFNTTEVFVVEEPGKLEDTIGATALAGGENVVIVLEPGLYPLLQNYILTTNVVIIADTGARRRMLRSEHDRALSGEPVVIYATQGSRHFVMAGATLWTDNIILQGAPTGLYSGGVELQNGAMGLFINTAFRSCRTAGVGGALQLTGGSTCTIGSGAIFADNVAAQGGAIHVAPGCTARINNTVSFTNNSAPRTSPTAGGGGAIWVGSGASVELDYAMTFAGNLDDDMTVAGGVVTCANPLYQTNCAAGCTGSYDIPASCPICSAGGTCTSCPKGSFGGASVALVCQLCPYGFTTIYPPSSTSSSACVPITQSPTATLSPTQRPTQRPTAPTANPTITPTSPPTNSPTPSPTAAPTQAGAKAPVVAKFTHDSCIAAPTAPSPPSFSGGALLTAGTGGTYATLSQAIVAATAGDRIQVLAGTIVEPAIVTVNKSLEIFGTGATCIVQRDSTTAVISIAAGVNNVYIHDLAVVNNQAPAPDTGGQSSCITAATMQEANPNGSTGIYIASCTFTYPKIGVSIDAAGWVVKDCVFTPNSNTPGSTIRALAPYGSRGQSFATGNTFNNPTEQGRLIAVALNSAGPRGVNFTTGWVGNFTLAENTISTSGGAPRAYIDTAGMYRQPGPPSSPGNNGEFSFYMQGNSFAVNYTSSPMLFYGSASVPAFGFFNVLLAKNNVFGARTTSSQKGALFFTASAAGTLGSFAGGFFSGGNTFSTPDVVIASTYADASYTPNLLVVESSIYAAPSPLISPIYPGGTTGLVTTDNVQLAAGDRVFAVDTCDATRSGLYVAAAGAWPRTADFAVGMDVSGSFFQVLNGTQYGNTSWNCTNAPGSDVVGTDPLYFGQV